MTSLNIPLVGLLLLFSVHLTAAFRIRNAALTAEDTDVLKLLLQRLGETIPHDQTLSKTEESDLKETRIKPQPRADIKGYLSAGDLRTVRKDSKRFSGCFGSKLDRIGSMTSLGCNTVGRSGPKK